MSQPRPSSTNSRVRVTLESISAVQTKTFLKELRAHESVQNLMRTDQRLPETIPNNINDHSNAKNLTFQHHYTFNLTIQNQEYDAVIVLDQNIINDQNHVKFADICFSARHMELNPLLDALNAIFKPLAPYLICNAQIHTDAKNQRLG